MQIKRLVDNLAIARQPLTPDDIISYLLVGLGLEYDSLVTTVFVCDDLLTLEEVVSMLLTYDARIQHHSLFISTSPVLVVTTQSIVSGNHDFGRENFSNVCGRGLGFRNSARGFGRGNFSSRNSDLWCQLVKKTEHITS